MPEFSPLDQALLRTVAYYDVFDYPLTSAEIWRWLYRRADETITATHAEVGAALAALVQAGTLLQEKDWFVLPGRQQLVQLRAERFVLGQKKWRRVKSMARFCEVIPYVKMVAACNTLAIDNARAESDMDVFIVTSPERMWIARMMVTGIVNMLGYRRHGKNITNRVCLSFYVTAQALDLEPLKISVGQEDPYLRFWATQIVPLMDDGIYEKFQQHNAWVTSRLPNGWFWNWKERLLSVESMLRTIKHSFEAAFATGIGLQLEDWARRFQLKRINGHTNSKAKLGTTEVIISENVLKFHEEDRRNKYNLAFRIRLAQLGIPE
mgnify:CR=1 FL=1